LNQWVEISFDCLPLRSVTRLDAPLDASPKLAEKFNRVKAAILEHGSFNTYYVHNAACRFHLTNAEEIGTVAFKFEGTVFTDEDDLRAVRTDLKVTLDKETCDWLTQSIVDWLAESVHRAVIVEFDRYIAAGDLQKTRERITQLEKVIDESQGFVGMYL
jgi:hypothetical protein